MKSPSAEKLKFELLETWNTFNHYITEALTFRNSEDVHQARVRLRKLLTFMQVYGSKPANYRQLKQLMSALGRVRDADVLCEQFDAQTPLEHAFLHAMEEERAYAQSHLQTVVTDLMTPSLDQQVRRFIGRSLHQQLLRQDAGTLLDHVKRQRKQTIKYYENEGSLERLHEVRLAVKRERYLHDYLLNYEEHASAEHIHQLKTWQTELGQLNDDHQLLLRFLSFKPTPELEDAYVEKIQSLQYTLQQDIARLQF